LEKKKGEGKERLKRTDKRKKLFVTVQKVKDKKATL